MGRRRISAAAGLAILVGCGGAGPRPDTVPVVLAEGHEQGQAWRLEGHRQAGKLCTSFTVVGLGGAPIGRCGFGRDELRHLAPSTTSVGGRLVVFSALPGTARRVRIDGNDASLHIEPARDATGFPGRFFVSFLDPSIKPIVTRVFGDGGRAVVP